MFSWLRERGKNDSRSAEFQQARDQLVSLGSDTKRWYKGRQPDKFKKGSWYAVLEPFLPKSVNWNWQQRPMDEVLVLVHLHNQLLPGAYAVVLHEDDHHTLHRYFLRAEDKADRSQQVAAPTLVDQYLDLLEHATNVLLEYSVGVPELTQHIDKREELIRTAQGNPELDADLHAMREELQRRKSSLKVARQALVDSLVSLGSAVAKSTEIAKATQAQKLVHGGKQHTDSDPQLDVRAIAQNAELSEAWEEALDGVTRMPTEGNARSVAVRAKSLRHERGCQCLACA